MSLVAAALIGPRVGRFNPVTGKPVPMPGHSSVLQVLGCFVLWFGWLGFNTGSVQSIVDAPKAAARVAVRPVLPRPPVDLPSTSRPAATSRPSSTGMHRALGRGGRPRDPPPRPPLWNPRLVG